MLNIHKYNYYLDFRLYKLNDLFIVQTFKERGFLFQTNYFSLNFDSHNVACDSHELRGK